MLPPTRHLETPALFWRARTLSWVLLQALILHIVGVSFTFAFPSGPPVFALASSIVVPNTHHSLGLRAAVQNRPFATDLKMSADEEKPNLKRKMEQEDFLAPLVGKDREFKIKREPEPGKVFQSGCGIGVFVTNPKYPGAILLGKRKGSAGSGTWALPGGHLDFGESFEDCAKRETLEETGLSLSNVRVATVNNAIDLPARYHYVVIFVKGETTEEPKNLEEEKCEGWQWIKWDDPDFPSPLFTALGNVRREGFDPIAA